jgi:GT2 family glycosyltransferase
MTSVLRPYVGQFDGINFGTARGWVRNQKDVNDKVLVELICDGYSIAFDRADITRPDAVQASEDCCVGYEIRVPRTALIVGKVFWIRVANTTIEFHFDGAQTERELERSINGEVHAGGSLVLDGWIIPDDQSLLPLTVVVREQGVEISRFQAEDKLRLPEEGRIPARARSFRHHLPFHLADQRVHVLDVETEDGRSLKGSPVTVAAWSTGAEDLIRHAQQNASGNIALQADLGAFALALGKSAVNYPVSTRFEDYAEWSKQFGPGPADKPAEGFTVFVYGLGDLTKTEASLDCQNADVTVRYVGSEGIAPEDWPTNGFVAFVQAGDWLGPNALARMAPHLRKAPVAYSDSDQLVEDTRVPWFKPDWDVFQFISQGYVFGLLVARASAWNLPADRSESCQIEDIAVAMINHAGDDVRHCDEVLYHQDAVVAHGAAPVDPVVFRAALSQFTPLVSAGSGVKEQQDAPWLNCLTWAAARVLPKVSIIIPTRDGLALLKAAVESIRDKTDYPDYEVLIGDNNSAKPETLDFLRACEKDGIHVVSCPGPFNFSAINNKIVEQATGEVLCLLNNDVVVTQESWLAELVQTLHQPRVGVVGAKLLWETEIVQHGGVILGIDGGAAHIGNTWSRDDQGYAGLNQIMHQSTCVTAACLVIRRADYQELGGLDATAFPVTFNDVDLCLRVRARGQTVVWTPQAELLHFESASRGQDELPQKAARAYRELTNLRKRWGDVLLHDPFYNRNLNRDRVPFEGLALPPFARPPEE